MTAHIWEDDTIVFLAKILAFAFVNERRKKVEAAATGSLRCLKEVFQRLLLLVRIFQFSFCALWWAVRLIQQTARTHAPGW